MSFSSQMAERSIFLRTCSIRPTYSSFTEIFSARVTIFLFRKFSNNAFVPSEYPAKFLSHSLSCCFSFSRALILKRKSWDSSRSFCSFVLRSSRLFSWEFFLSRSVWSDWALCFCFFSCSVTSSQNFSYLFW